ncbi:uncharacterized protein DFL_009691 [Arthrobotrys flagrans]|uniref:Uncharacterized protein n=1 Tax=Arthrobotrys flagrans TaxID=97331 RepID=A0A436ZSE0_ARTFL|nr:hypothetical protein DFL_009691 [Arthrobotrys flagrans]
MSQKTNGDLLDFGQDIKRMSADNITPPDTASKPREESTATGKPASGLETHPRSTGFFNVKSGSAAAAARRREDKSDGKE